MSHSRVCFTWFCKTALCRVLLVTVPGIRAATNLLTSLTGSLTLTDLFRRTGGGGDGGGGGGEVRVSRRDEGEVGEKRDSERGGGRERERAFSYTHLRAH